MLRDSTTRFVGPSVRWSVTLYFFLVFAVFCLTAPAQMIMWPQIQPLPTCTQLGLPCIRPCLSMQSICLSVKCCCCCCCCCCFHCHFMYFFSFPIVIVIKIVHLIQSVHPSIRSFITLSSICWNSIVWQKETIINNRNNFIFLKINFYLLSWIENKNNTVVSFPTNDQSWLTCPIFIIFAEECTTADTRCRLTSD